MEEDILHTTAVASAAALRRGAGWLIGMGVVWILLGLLAAIVPFAAGLAVELLLGALLLVGGAGQTVQAFRCREWSGFGLHLLGGLLGVAAGLLLVLFPWQGMLALAIALGAFFLLNGAVKVALAVAQRSARGASPGISLSWGWIGFSGVLDLAIGLLILVAGPGSAAWVLGLLVGIGLLLGGWSMVALGLSARRLTAHPA